MGQPGSPRSYVSGHYALELDGSVAGWLESVNTGVPGQFVNTPGQSVGAPTQLVFQCGSGMSPQFYRWISESFSQPHRRSGSLIIADYNYKEISRLSWSAGLISEIGLPALDSSSKDPAKMTIKFKPEYTRTGTATGGGATVAPAHLPLRQKTWLPSNFRFHIDGFDDACRKCTKVDAITIHPPQTQANVTITIDPQAGAQIFKSVQQSPGPKSGFLEFSISPGMPPLRVTLSDILFDPMQPLYDRMIASLGSGVTDVNLKKEVLTPRIFRFGARLSFR